MIAEVGGALRLRPSRPWPKVLFLPFEKVVNMYNASFSFRCLVLFVEGVGTEDKRKMGRLIICELPNKLNLPPI